MALSDESAFAYGTGAGEHGNDKSLVGLWSPKFAQDGVLKNLGHSEDAAIYDGIQTLSLNPFSRVFAGNEGFAILFGSLNVLSLGMNSR
jgi:hypothetical protein